MTDANDTDHSSASAATTASSRAPTPCEDCLVSFVLGREPDDAVVVDVEEARAMRMLARAGLVPELRHSGVDRDWAAG